MSRAIHTRGRGRGGVGVEGEGKEGAAMAKRAMRIAFSSYKIGTRKRKDYARYHSLNWMR